MQHIANTFRKTRLAPTPSGYLHMGNVLSFAITAALADRTGAKILLRIDDADRERTNKLYVQDIFDTLNFLEIPWHEGPRNMKGYEQQYSQAHRMDMYFAALQELRDSGALFACTCTRTDLARRHPESHYTGTCRNANIPLDTENVNWRIRTDARELIVHTFNDGDVKTELHPSLQDLMVRKRDGFPTYQLTSLVDDVYFGVDLIVRGQDLWPSTLAQHYLARQLGYTSFTNATFYHHPLVLDAEGNKLSKSIGSRSILYLRKEHKKPADIYAYIAGILGIDTALGSWNDLSAYLKG